MAKGQADQWLPGLEGPPKRRVGRPSHKVTIEKQRLVQWLAAHGWPQAKIAADLGIDEKTLRKHYSVFLDMDKKKGGLS